MRKWVIKMEFFSSLSHYPHNEDGKKNTNENEEKNL